MIAKLLTFIALAIYFPLAFWLAFKSKKHKKRGKYGKKKTHRKHKN